MRFGLNDIQFEQIVGIISNYPEIQQALIFGSRADGTNKESSDVDIAIKCPVSDSITIGKLLVDFEESSLPFFFDVVDYNKTENEKLKSHIDEYGVVFYEKK
jgi:predicted nucleotidyltransferase